MGGARIRDALRDIIYTSALRQRGHSTQVHKICQSFRHLIRLSSHESARKLPSSQQWYPMADIVQLRGAQHSQ